MAGTIFEENYRAVMRDQLAIEFEALDPQGKRWCEFHSYPSRGGISVFFRDITERKRMEDERLTTSKLESLGTLAGGIVICSGYADEAALSEFLSYGRRELADALERSLASNAAAP